MNYEARPCTPPTARPPAAPPSLPPSPPQDEPQQDEPASSERADGPASILAHDSAVTDAVPPASKSVACISSTVAPRAPTISPESSGYAEPPSKRRLILRVNVRNLVNDLSSQVATARSDLMAAWKSGAKAVQERDRLRQDVSTMERRVERAEVLSSQAMEWHRQADENSHAKARLNGLQTAYQKLQAELRDEQESKRNVEADCKKLKKELGVATASLRSLEGAKARHQSAREELAKQGEITAATKGEVAKLRQRVRQLEAELKEMRESLEAATEQLDSTEKAHEKEVERLQAAVADAAADCDRWQSRFTDVVGETRGRPRGHNGRKSLEEKWDKLAPKARRMALYRHANDIKDALRDAGAEDWLPSSFALALKSLGLLDDLLCTKAIALRHFESLEHLAELLAAEWGAKLALFLRSELGLSDRNYDKARLAFSSQYNSTSDRWTHRNWYTCPITGKSLKMPQPLVSRYVWFPAWKQYVEGQGLALSADGKVCERSLLASARFLIDRDRAQLTDPALGGWVLTFGIDGTAISSKRAFTHASLSIASMYKQRKAVLSEMKVLTLAIGQYKDDAHGLPRLLHGKTAAAGKAGTNVDCLAAEINSLYARPWLLLNNGDEVHCNIRCCLDLAAVRGMRACRGKAAALCGCRGKPGRQILPGEDGVAALPDGDDLLAWRATEKILMEHCSFGSNVMSYESLLDAAHCPPPDHNFSLSPWKCRHCQLEVFRSWEEFTAAKAELEALKETADGGDKDAEKLYAKVMREHAETHLDQSKFQPPVLQAGTDIFIVDSLHCLQLNVAKTAWKYSYGNKMDEHARTRASEYMESIGCYLDLRAKAQRNPETKFMNGSTVDDFVLGKLRDVKSRSPGLAVNTLALCEIVYGGYKTSSAVSTTAAPTAVPAASTSRPPAAGGGTKRKRRGPTVGFVACTNAADDEETNAQHAVNADADKADEFRELLTLQGADERSDSAEMRAYLTSNFGNHAANVLSVLKLWEAYGKLYNAWCDPWPTDSTAYRAQRAMHFLRAAIDFSRALNKVSNYGHMSWYVHYIVWIVPRQIVQYGDLWRFSTIMIESRGAKLKKLGRQTVSWRPLQASKTVYNYVDRQTGRAVRRAQGYRSSPMEHMCARMLMIEDLSHDTSSVFARPENLRLKQQLRSCKLKCELADDISLSDAMTMLNALQNKQQIAEGA